ncbi:MAG: TonB-dependent receptor plug domain-containing protein [Panacagrimonas sp.]
MQGDLDKKPQEAPCLLRRLAMVSMLLGSSSAHANTQISAAGDYLSLSLEELMEVNVTTVAGTPESRFASPAALTVISGDAIRRAGHRSIAEALRMVPGMYVGRINASSYVIGARGLTASVITSTRYLVLVDGRVVHDPLVSTTLWDVTDVVMEDIDRIEVIRGPGATLWGQNAMNGVINVITRSARDTQGSLLSAGAGDSERIATLRHGFTVGKTAVRAFAKFADYSEFERFDGSSNNDAYSTARAGIRAEHAQSERTTWTLDANLYQLPTADLRVDVPVPGVHAQFVEDTTPDDISGGHLLLRMNHDMSPGSGLSAQAYYDRVERDGVRIGNHRNTVDVDVCHWTPLGARNEFIWGVGFREHDDRIENGSGFRFDPMSRKWTALNGFVQNTSELVSERVFLMLGSKFSHHDFVGSYTQPGARLWWTPSDRQTLWGAVSRSVRVPSRLEESGFIVLAIADSGLLAGTDPTNVFVPVGVSGDDDLKPERLLAYELGHRYRFGDWLALDVAAFRNDYQRLIGIPAQVFGNLVDSGQGETHGGEIAASIKPLPQWQMEASYSYLETTVSGPVLKFDESNVPRHLAQWRSSWKARSDLELNSSLYYVGRIEGLPIDAYARFDLGLTWDVRPGLQLALWGQNLTDGERQENSAVEISRSFYAQLQLDL